MRRILLAISFCLSLHSLIATAASPTKPNVVFLLVDDLRWNALGCMGDKIVKTPNIDKLAKRGVLFENMFVTTSICWSSRATMFTGQWMRRHGVGLNDGKEMHSGAWAQTYPAQFRAAGFRTGFIGKFGVGTDKKMSAMESEFDYWKGLPGQGGKLFIDPNDPTHQHKTALFGDQALEFISGCKADQPFSLSVSFNAVHARDHEPREYTPDMRDEGMYDGIEIPLSKLATDEAFKRLPEFVQKSEGRTRWAWRFDEPQKAQSILHDYYCLITGVDREVGRIMEAIEKKGVADNTIIVFAGDNGYSLADRGLADKWFAYEEDLRVPLIIVDPRLPASRHGVREKTMALNVDIAPTMLDLAGVSVPSVMQGRSLKPVLAGEKPADWRTEFFYEHHAVPARIPPVEAVRTERWKYIRWIKSDPLVEELYDLQNDPLEEKNVIADQKHAALLKELREKWERYGKEME